MYFDRFDILDAYYLFGTLYHSGQGSREYGYISRANRAGYRPSVLLSEETLTENARAIYDALVMRFEESLMTSERESLEWARLS